MNLVKYKETLENIRNLISKIVLPVTVIKVEELYQSYAEKYVRSYVYHNFEKYQLVNLNGMLGQSIHK